MIPSKRVLVDLAERAGATFAQAFFASITLGHTVAPVITNLRALEIAATAGGYAVGKFLLVKANAWLAKSDPADAAAAAPRPVVSGS